MKRNSLRRLWALVLALSLTLSLAPPAWAAGSATVTIGKKTLSLETGATSEKLTATVTNIPTDNAGNPVTVTYEWVFSSPNGETVTFGSKNAAETTVTAGNKAGQGTITINVKWKDPDDSIERVATDTCQLTITAAATPDPTPTTPPTTDPPTPTVPVETVELDKTSLDLAVGGTETLTATVTPDNATNKTVAWSATNGTGEVTVDQTGKVTAVKAGTATITATAGGKSATCTVTVTAQTVTGLTFGGTDSPIIRSKGQDKTWPMTVNTVPAGVALPEGSITWSIRTQPGDSREILSLPAGAADGIYTGGATVNLTSGQPGRVTVTAQYGSLSASKDVVVSGIVLNAENLTMQVGETKALTVGRAYGMAEGGLPNDEVWTSTDPSTVTVSKNGELIAWKLGSAVITANKNGYTAECYVEVKEDEDTVIGGLSATASEPLIFDTLYDRINEISLRKTRVVTITKDEDGNEVEVETKPGSPLNYIINVKVPTSHGTLYYNYDSEANTGAGVGANDRFAKNRSASIQQTLDKLYFVPKQGFNGTAEITFTGWAQNGSSFAATVRVDVAGAQGIRYKTTSGQPAYFLGSDFNAYCRVRTGRDLSYVTFNLPQSSQGGLYYGYTSSGQYAGRVSTSTQYGRSGRNVIDDVCFVPTDAFVGETRISFRCVDTAGNPFNAEVIVSVNSAGSAGETANVNQTGQWGEPVELRPELFNAACQSTIGDTLAYVRFQIPSYDKGVLYYNYQGGTGSRVDNASRYYYSGSPGLGSVTFVPASNDADRVAIHYTGYGEGGTSYTGILYITLGEEERYSVHYAVPKGGAVSLRASDFNDVALFQMGTSLDYVTFQLGGLTLGQLYYDYRGSNSYNTPVSSGTAYYRNPGNTWTQRLDRISFHAGNRAGTVTIPFTAYSAADRSGIRKSCQGTLLIQVGAEAPADINLSGYASSQLWLSGYEISRVCAQTMSQELSYIQITGLPGPEEGVLYYGYHGFKTGSQVQRGDRYYRMGAPNIDQLCFVPWGSFSGQAEITYIGYNTSGVEQVSGRIVLNVSRAANTYLYNDMGRHVWAADAVEFLSRNGTVNGIGGGRYNPTGLITKGDFTLMLVRAFGFRASGTVSYSDVPANSYYAQAISIASQKGIVSGSNGRFEPKKALTRQEAMVMIYNALKVDGHSLNNGLTADLNEYRDGGEVDPSARTALGTLILMGVVEGDGNGALRPRSTLNRAETACLMHRLMTLPGGAG